jgi:hypothetical protein
MDERVLYRKVGRRYVEVGREFTGFPMNGVWLVEDGRMSCIMKVGELLDPLPLSQMMRGESQACAALRRLLDDKKWNVSISDMVSCVLKAVAKQLEHEQYVDLDYPQQRGHSWSPPPNRREPRVG